MNGYLFYRRIFWPVILLTFGITALLAEWDVLSFGRSWPLYLIVYGVLRLAEGTALAASPPLPVYPTPGYSAQGPGFAPQGSGYAQQGYGATSSAQASPIYGSAPSQPSGSPVPAVTGHESAEPVQSHNAAFTEEES